MRETSMNIESFVAPTADEALAQARTKLGLDALLLQTKRLTDGGRFAGYEVVMGKPQAAQPTRPLEEPPSLPFEAPSVPEPEAPVRQASDPVAKEVQKLRAQMDEIHALLKKNGSVQRTQRAVSELSQVYTRLTSAGVDAALSQDIADRLEGTMAADSFASNVRRTPVSSSGLWRSSLPDTERMERLLRTEFEQRVPLTPFLGSTENANSSVSIFVGPAGSGKTTTIAKLAVSLSAERRVLVLSSDFSRPGAVEQLRSLVPAQRVSFGAVKVASQLPVVLAQTRNVTVLVDTPGFAIADREQAEELATALSRCSSSDVHLVMPAYMNPADFRRVVQRYKMFGPTKLLVTKLDETRNFGTAFSEANRAGLPLSFQTAGRNVPKDLQPASHEGLLSQVLDRPWSAVEGAA